jgi:hypothetical protein
MGWYCGLYLPWRNRWYWYDSTSTFRTTRHLQWTGNIRQELLHCIRYAISAGAGMILPLINLRSNGNLSDLNNGIAGLDYLFDQDRFVSRLKSSCPQMPIYTSLEELQKLGPVITTETLEPRKLFHWFTSPAAYSARPRVQELKDPAGQISLIPFEHVWQYL